MHGRSQAVRLPKEFRFPGKEVRIRRDGDRVILEPVEFDVAGLVQRSSMHAATSRSCPKGIEQPPPAAGDESIFDE